jgi:hypothetical protein
MACLDMMTQPTWAFSPKAETGEPSPPPFTGAAQPTDSGQSVARGKHGGAGEELWTTGNPWVALGWKGTHHSGLAVVREDDNVG